MKVVWLGIVALLAAQPAIAANAPPFVDPVFLLPANASLNDYRPVLNADGTVVIFERNAVATPSNVTLYSANLSTGDVTQFTTLSSSRADWCWQKSGKQLVSGPVAFSSDDGIYTVAPGGLPVLVPNTAEMIYPSWYPDCRHVAADGGTTHATTIVDVTNGKVSKSLQRGFPVWSGFASVNQANPNLVSFAGQNNVESNYYDQELNYTWVVDRSRFETSVKPMDDQAPKGPSFIQKYQARAGWWSHNGKWFAFESNRICNNITGATYAIFIQDSSGRKPAMQVTACDKWNVQHPKWFPPGTNNGTPMLIVAAAQAGNNQPFAIASLDVSGFVGKQ